MSGFSISCYLSCAIRKLKVATRKYPFLPEYRKTWSFQWKSAPRTFSFGISSAAPAQFLLTMMVNYKFRTKQHIAHPLTTEMNLISKIRLHILWWLLRIQLFSFLFPLRFCESIILWLSCWLHVSLQLAIIHLCTIL